jgi:hypothetical protein
MELALSGIGHLASRFGQWKSLGSSGWICEEGWALRKLDITPSI